MYELKSKIEKLKLYGNIFLKKRKKYFFKLAESESEFNKMFQLRYMVYCKEFNYCRHYDERKKIEKDKYDSFSDHIIALNKNLEVIGTVRLIRDSNIGFQVEEYVKLPDEIDRKRSVEISRFCIRKDERGGNKQVTLGLSKKIYQYSKKNNIKYWLAVLNLASWKVFINFGINFTLLSDVRNWKHGKTKINVVPVYLDIEKTEKFMPYINFSFYKFITGSQKNIHSDGDKKNKEEIKQMLNKIKNDMEYIEALNNTK